jgi:hypothetical protein
MASDRKMKQFRLTLQTRREIAELSERWGTKEKPITEVEVITRCVGYAIAMEDEKKVGTGDKTKAGVEAIVDSLSPRVRDPIFKPGHNKL